MGKGGAVIAVDASPGMLAQAKRLATEHAWQNVDLVQQDAELLAVNRDLDGVLFSLSYSVIPHPSRALQAAWAACDPGAES